MKSDVENPLTRAYRLGEEIDRLMIQAVEKDPILVQAYKDLLGEPIRLGTKAGMLPGYDIYIFAGKSPLALDPAQVQAWNEENLPWVQTGEEGSEVAVGYLLPGNPDPDRLGEEMGEFARTILWDFALLARRAFAWLLLGEVKGGPIPQTPYWPQYQGRRARLEEKPHPHLVFPGTWIHVPPVLLASPEGTRFILPSALPQGLDPQAYLQEAEETAYALMQQYYLEALRQGKLRAPEGKEEG